MPDSAFLPLHNFEAEQAVLGAALADNAAYAAVADFLAADAFADPFHRELYRAIGRLRGEGRPATPVTLRGLLDCAPVGGPAYLARLVAASVGAGDAVALAGIVQNLHVQRQALAAMQSAIEETRAADAAFDPAVPLGAVADRLGALAAESATCHEARPFAAVVDRVLETADAIYKSGGGLSGIATGYAGLDAMLGGLQGGDLVVLAGRPSMGKTALATTLATHVAGEGRPVGFFSLEMSAEQLGARILSGDAALPGSRVRQGTLDGAEMQRYLDAGNDRMTLPLFIDDTGALTVAALGARARRLVRRHGIGLLVVDYLQLLSGPDRRDGRTQEVSDITRSLKALARELDLPVLALSQLSRAVEGRTDKRPMLSDLRESGSIEQDADVVMFVYREEYYCERSDKRGTQAHIDAIGKAELIVAKQRRGPTGTIPLAFDAAITRFRDAASCSSPPPGGEVG